MAEHIHRYALVLTDTDMRWCWQSSASSKPWELIVAVQCLPATKLKSDPEPDSLSSSGEWSRQWSLSATDFTVSIIAVMMWGSPNWMGGTGLRARALLPNRKPNEMEVGKWKIAGFPPIQFCKEKGRVATGAESSSSGSWKFLDAGGMCRSKLAALSQSSLECSTFPSTRYKELTHDAIPEVF